MQDPPFRSDQMPEVVAWRESSQYRNSSQTDIATRMRRSRNESVSGVLGWTYTDRADCELGVDVIESGGRRETWKIVEDLIRCLGDRVSEFFFSRAVQSRLIHSSCVLLVVCGCCCRTPVCHLRCITTRTVSFVRMTGLTKLGLRE